MAEEIVACPGCGKKFKIPEGAPGGAFQCTACNANVPYGKAARPAAPARGAPAKAAPAAKQSAKPAAKAPAKAAPASKPARGAAGKRHAREEPEEEEDDRGRRGHGAKDRKKDDKTVLWVSLAVVAVLVVVFVVIMNKKKPEPIPATQTPAPVVAPPAPVVAPTPAPASAGGAAPSGSASGASAGTDASKGGESGIGGTKTTESSSGSSWSSKGDDLYVRIPDIAGVTPEERSDMDKLVATFVDRDSGKPGIDARNKLKKLGRKAVPALLSAFETHWKGKKWDDDVEKFGSFQIQQLMVDISKADRPGGDFVARYVPQDPKSVDAKTFERAARMWVTWWNGKGKDIEKFKDFAE